MVKQSSDNFRKLITNNKALTLYKNEILNKAIIKIKKIKNEIQNEKKTKIILHKSQIFMEDRKTYLF